MASKRTEKQQSVQTEAAPRPGVFDTFEGCLDAALGMITEPGLALEFGVSTGGSLRRIVAGMPAESRVIGFDSFDGLPEHWRVGFDRGMFRATPPDVDGAELVIGLYSDTLPEWVPDEDDPAIALVHIDCDLYSSTRTVLEHIGPLLKPGALIVFDEFHGYPGFEDHEAKAWGEYADATGAKWTEFARGPEQLLIRLDS